MGLRKNNNVYVKGAFTKNQHTSVNLHEYTRVIALDVRIVILTGTTPR